MKKNHLFPILALSCWLATTALGQITHTVYPLQGFGYERTGFHSVTQLQDGSLLMEISRGITGAEHLGVTGLALTEEDGTVRHLQIVRDSAFLNDIPLIRQMGDTLHCATSIDTLFLGGDYMHGGNFKVSCHFYLSASTGEILDMWLPSYEDFWEAAGPKMSGGGTRTTVKFTDTSAFQALWGSSRDSLHVHGIETSFGSFLKQHRYTLPTEPGGISFIFTKVPSGPMYIYFQNINQPHEVFLSSWTHEGDLQWRREIVIPDLEYLRQNVRMMLPVVLDNSDVAVSYSSGKGTGGSTGIALFDENGNLLWHKSILRTSDWYYPNMSSLIKTNTNTLLGVAAIRWRNPNRPAPDGVDLSWYFFEMDNKGNLLWEYNEQGKADIQFGFQLLKKDAHTVWGFGLSERLKQVRIELHGIPTSVPDIKLSPSLRLYPQPAQTYLRIEGIDDKVSSRTIRYYVKNILGATVQDGELARHQLLHIAGLQSGMYFFIAVTDTGERYSQSFVISR